MNVRVPGRLPRDAGLTILELMIVLVILSLIGSVVAVQVMGQMDRAKVDVARLQLRQLESALTLYQLDTHALPDDAVGLAGLQTQPAKLEGWRGPYIKAATLLVDPWGHGVEYALDGSSYTLTSRGADGKAGGDGGAADIVIVGAQ